MISVQRAVLVPPVLTLHLHLREVRRLAAGQQANRRVGLDRRPVADLVGVRPRDYLVVRGELLTGYLGEPEDKVWVLVYQDAD